MIRRFTKNFSFVLFDAHIAVALTVSRTPAEGEDALTRANMPALGKTLRVGSQQFRTSSNNRRKTSVNRRERREQRHFEVRSVYAPE